jgi:hypothetical protein
VERRQLHHVGSERLRGCKRSFRSGSYRCGFLQRLNSRFASGEAGGSGGSLPLSWALNQRRRRKMVTTAASLKAPFDGWVGLASKAGRNSNIAKPFWGDPYSVVLRPPFYASVLGLSRWESGRCWMRLLGPIVISWVEGLSGAGHGTSLPAIH